MDILTLSLAVKKVLAQLGVGVETQSVVIASGTTATEHDAELGIIVGAVTPNEAPTEGNTYTVIFDGTKYSCDYTTAEGLPALGNTGLFGGTDTGEPFLLVYESEAALLVIVQTEGEHTVSVTQETETIHPIDPKYLTTVIDLDEHGIDVQALVLAGGGIKTRDNSAIFNKIKRGGNYLFRGSFNNTTVDLPARFYQYTSDGALYAVGMGLAGNLGSGGVQIDFVIAVDHVECILTPLGTPPAE